MTINDDGDKDKEPKEKCLSKHSQFAKTSIKMVFIDSQVQNPLASPQVDTESKSATANSNSNSAPALKEDIANGKQADTKEVYMELQQLKVAKNKIFNEKLKTLLRDFGLYSNER